MKFPAMLLPLWFLLRCTGSSMPVIPANFQAPTLTIEAIAQPAHFNRDSLIADSIDQRIFNQKLRIATETAGGIKAKTLAVMRSFLGTPYGTGTLDGFNTEHLVINLRALDCWTSVECCLAIAVTASDSTPDYRRYRDLVRSLRYHDGIIDGYGSRIHYFCGWILQNEQKGWFRDVTAELGGIAYKKNITYITDVPFYYPQADDPIAREKINAAQKRISAHAWHYFPKHQVAGMESKIQEGDIIVITSSRPNLDVEHQGFAIKKNGRIHLLHASSTGKKVMITPKPLSNYLAGIPKMSGIMVVSGTGVARE